MVFQLAITVSACNATVPSLCRPHSRSAWPTNRTNPCRRRWQGKGDIINIHTCPSQRGYKSEDTH